MLDGPIRRSPLRRARATIAVMSDLGDPSPDSGVVTMTAPRIRLSMHASIVDSNDAGRARR